jgi:uncharacterized SAM-binding protein YcdF (DUF218 family)
MLFDLLRFFTPLLHPVGMLWFACLAGAGICLWKKRKAPALALAVVALLISLMASGLSGSLLARLERPYARESLADVPVCDAVVVLGGGIAVSGNDPLGFTFTDAGDRIVAAIEVMRQGKAPVLVLGGGYYHAGDDEVSDVSVVRQWVERWGLVTNEIASLGVTHNTREEALQVKELAGQRGWKKVILVTSAFHMKRTEAVFRTAGLEVVPVACDFNTVGRPKPRPSFNPFPRPEGLAALDYWLHEQVGMLVYRLRGWIGEPPPPGPPAAGGATKGG